MTRKDYIAIAQALKAARPAVVPGTNAIVNDTERKVWYAAVSEVSKVLARDNARFQGSRFFDACGVPD